MIHKGPEEAATDDRDIALSPSPIRIDLAKLLEGRREAIIVHNGQDYRLRVTSNGKLILTK